MSQLSDFDQNNEQILNDIQSLQQIETQLFNNLESNPNLTPQQQKQTIEKMNQLSNMRINLYQTLSGINNFYQNALTSSVGTLREQTIAVGIVENELNQAKKRLKLLEEEKNNKIRLVQINDYYGDKYAEHSDLMKIIIFTLVPIIILVLLKNKGLLPDIVFYVILVIISVIGSYFFWIRFSSIIRRDNMNYNEYNWTFNPDDAPTSDTSGTDNDPWVSLKAPGTCVGEYCCSDGLVWDSSLNQCVISNTSTESFITESMVNDVLTKQQPNKFNKNDYKMGGDYQGFQSKSFINNSKIN